jgi:hypothetical protein
MGGKKIMKRILGAVVAFAAVLSLGTVSHAAIITYDVSGYSSLNTGNSLPPPPYFTTPASAGSSLTINTDTNGDSVVGDVSLVSGHLNLVGSTDTGFGLFNSNVVTTFTGGTGTLSGSTILWSSSTLRSNVGTFTCTSLVCGALGVTEGPTYDISIYDAYLVAPVASGGAGLTSLNPFSLGAWNFSPGGISTVSPTGISVSYVSIGSAGASPAIFYVFGGTVPEPGTFALVLLGLGGLALRSRKV